MEELFDLTDVMRDHFLKQSDPYYSEKSLSFGVLERAIDDLRLRKYRDSAIYWFKRRDEEGIYSFRGICDTFDIKTNLDVMADSIISRTFLKWSPPHSHMARFFKGLQHSIRVKKKQEIVNNNKLARKMLMLQNAKRRSLKNKRKRVRARIMLKIFKARGREVRMKKLIQPEYIY